MKKLFLSITLVLWTVVLFSQTVLSADSVYYDKKGKTEVGILKIEGNRVKFSNISIDEDGKKIYSGLLKTLPEDKFSKKFKTRKVWESKGGETINESFISSGWKANRSANTLYGIGFGMMTLGATVSLSSDDGAEIGLPITIVGSLLSTIGFINARIGSTKSSKRIRQLLDEMEKQELQEEYKNP